MFKAADAARTKLKSTLTVAHNFNKDITDFSRWRPICTSVLPYVPRVPMNIHFCLQRTTADNSAAKCTFIYNYMSV